MARQTGRFAVVDWKLEPEHADAYKGAFLKALAKTGRATVLPRLKNSVPELSKRSRASLYLQRKRRSPSGDGVEVGYRGKARYFGATRYKHAIREQAIQELPGLFPAAMRSAQRVLPKER